MLVGARGGGRAARAKRGKSRWATGRGLARRGGARADGVLPARPLDTYRWAPTVRRHGAVIFLNICISIFLKNANADESAQLSWLGKLLLLLLL